jgi:hypothetical protein
MGSNKQGIIRPDSDGYYTVVLGALDFHNSAGQFYSFEGSKQVFEDSSSFMRRVQAGSLRGECGHPRKLPGMSTRDFISRVLDIEETNVSHHIKEITIERSKVKDKSGRPCVAIIGKVKPAGPKGSALQAAFENKHENICFSIRSLTEDVVSPGSWTKNIKTCVTFDWVNEPGIHVAQKYFSPALESRDFTKQQFVDVSRHGTLAMGMEDDSHVSPIAVLKDFNMIQRPEHDRPRSMDW